MIKMINTNQDRIRVYRFLILEGDRSWVESQLENSITRTKIVDGRKGYGKISVFTLGEIPDLIKQHECFGEIEEVNDNSI